jgi:hypothetical protein
MQISDRRTTTPSEFSIESIQLRFQRAPLSFFYLIVSLKPQIQTRTRGQSDAFEERKFPTELIIGLTELQQIVGTLTSELDETVSRLIKDQR